MRPNRGNLSGVAVSAVGGFLFTVLSVAAWSAELDDAFDAQDRGDFASALRIFQTLAEEGDDRALFNLGLMYRHGRGVSQNNQVAVEYYWRSADKGNQYAQYSLGFMYDIGEGVEQNFERAAYWYLKSAEQGNENAEFNLANMYREGQGVKKDLTKAFRLFKKFAERGDPEAQTTLGYMFANGDGVALNDVYAYMWWIIAASNGQEVAASNLIMAREFMNTAQTAKASELAEICVRQNYKEC